MTPEEKKELEKERGIRIPNPFEYTVNDRYLTVGGQPWKLDTRNLVVNIKGEFEVNEQLLMPSDVFFVWQKIRDHITADFRVSSKHYKVKNEQAKKLKMFAFDVSPQNLSLEQTDDLKTKAKFELNIVIQKTDFEYC